MKRTHNYRRLRLAASFDSYKDNSTFYLRSMVDSWHDHVELEREGVVVFGPLSSRLEAPRVLDWVVGGLQAWASTLASSPY